MKKLFFGVLFSTLLTGLATAETAVQDTQSVPVAETTVPITVPAAPANPAAEAPVTPAVAAPGTPAAAAPVVPPVEEIDDLENLEFVSGEVSGLDETAQTVTVKLYGETEDGKGDKVLTVKVDDATDITDGEKDRDLKSLIAGTEVDVEYDPATNKATYIFVY